jgi:adenine-specific DNA-methyltransferase
MTNGKIYRSFNTKNRVTISNNDCLKFAKKLPAKSVQLIVTSPPYNISKEYEKKVSIDNYLEFHSNVIDECKRILKPKGSICWQTGNYIYKNHYSKSVVPLDIEFYNLFKQKDFHLRNRIIWSFGHGLNNTNRLSGRYEVISWYTFTNEYLFKLDEVRVKQKYPGKRSYRGSSKGKVSGNIKGKNPSDFWDDEDIIFNEIKTDTWKNIPNVKGNHIEKTDHPCQYPIALVSRLIKLLSNKNHLVFDPFIGAGTTAVSGIINGRRVAGCDNNEEYYKIAVHNIKQALNGTLRVREDKPNYRPNKNISVTSVPDEWK